MRFVQNSRSRAWATLPVLILVTALVLGRKGVAYLQIPGFPIFYTDWLLIIMGVIGVRSIPSAVKLSVANQFLVVFLSFVTIRLLVDLSVIPHIDHAIFVNFGLVFYPIFAVASFAWASTARLEKNVWATWLSITFILNGIIGLTYPFRWILSALVWHSTPDVSILFTYAGNTAYFPIAIFFFLVVPMPTWQKIIGLITNSIGLLLLMERAPIVSLALTAGALVILSPKYLRRILGGAVVLVVALVITVTFARFVEFESRVDASLTGYADLVVSIFDSSSEAGLQGTRTHRINLWRETLSSWSRGDNAVRLFFGNGFQKNVFIASFRAPHNSFLHILSRVGLVGLTALLVALMLAVLRIAQGMSRADQALKSLLLWHLLVVLVTICDASFGTLFENPFVAGPIFFILGVGGYFGRVAFGCQACDE